MKSDNSVRSIDSAMIESRSQKDYIRSLWVSDIKIENSTYNSDDYPLYLTLCGAEGTDLLLLEKAQVIRRESTGAIAAEHMDKVVAIENSKPAIAKLQGKIMGLRILEQDVKSLMRGDSLIKYPDRMETKYLSAHVINLDFNSPLIANIEGGEFVCPQFKWIQKIATIQKEAHKPYWKLYLTLNSSLTWSSEVTDEILKFLKQNMDSSPNFTSLIREYAPRLAAHIENRVSDANFIQDDESIRHLLMIFVPKKLASIITGLGYSVETFQNLTYGGDNGTAPMVTWMIKCEALSAVPAKIYNDNLVQIFDNFSKVELGEAQ